MATVNTPAMTWKLIGKGSQYAWGYLDAKGNCLDGKKTYKLNLPKDPPAEKFTSVVVYDPQTRSQLQTSQPFPSYNNVRDKDKVIVNDDGSLDLYFGPRRRPVRKRTGSKRFAARVGSASCASIVRPRRRSTKPGDRVRLNW